MIDRSRRLHELLEQLHTELEASENIDAETEAELRGAMADIRAALAARPPLAADEEVEAAEDIGDAGRHHGMLSEAAREFNASHPLLARTIGQLADILGQSGI